MAEPRYGFVGAGRMATAMARGLVEAGMARSESIVASDPLPAARAAFAEAVGAQIVATNRDVADGSDVVFLAVKPQSMPGVLRELAGHLHSGHLVVSIAAGIRLHVLLEGLAGGEGTAQVKKGPRLVRVMPNTPCLVGQSASGYCLGPGATPADDDLVAKLLKSVGVAIRVEEELLDAVTGLSGSGPAFVYLIIEGLSDGGVQMGLPRNVATRLAAQTVKGAAEMVLATGEHPAQLKDNVASPGGTTIAGLAALEAGSVRSDLMAAVAAATRRSIELGGEKDTSDDG